MKKLNPPSTSRRSVIFVNAILCALWFIFVPAAAQQSPVGSVPDNIAPHPAPVQPLPFSHKLHLASGLTCQTCHINPDPGSHMTFPVTETCLSCHRTIARDRPAIIKLQGFSESGRQIPWVRVYAITPGVNWSHRVHLDAGSSCRTCHGDVTQMETMAETKATRAMATCISCHQASEAPYACVTCHAWPTDQDLGLE